MLKNGKYIWYNGKMIPWNEAKFHVMSHSLHYGSSIFEGIRFYESCFGTVIFRYKEHIQRLLNSAKIYRIPLQYTSQDLMSACKEVICKNNLTSGYLRPLIFIGDVGMGVNPPKNYKSETIIAAFKWKSYFDKDNSDSGISAMVSSWNRLAPNTIPTLAKAAGNYLSSFLIGGEARRNGYQEGIGLDVNGYISEGAGENLFEVKDNILYTSSLSSSILPGITRDTIIKLSAELGYSVFEQTLSRESLYLSDEVFMTGTAAEITPVCSIDGIKIGSGKCGIITKNIQNSFFGLFNGSTRDKWGWLEKISF